MKISQDVREFADQQEIEKGMQEKSKEFLAQGAEVYRPE